MTPSQAALLGTSQRERVEVDPTRPTWMEIDIDALEHNYLRVRDLVGPGVTIIPCVKSAAYGLDLPGVARRLVSLGAGTFFCGSLADARAVRQAGLTRADLVIFGGALPEGMRTLVDLDLIPTVHNRELADAVSSCAHRPARVYVKVDAGRGRLGFPLRTAEEDILRVASLPRVTIVGAYTHLPFTDRDGARWAQDRTTRFDELIDRLRRRGLAIPVTQARSSSGLLVGITDRCNAVAPGRLLYGKPALPSDLADAHGYRPLLAAIRSRLIHVSPDAADRTPGLSGRYAHRVTGATGVIPFGRKDGNAMPRHGQVGHVLVKGAKAPVLSVSSEHAVLDLSAVEDPKVGDGVVVVGRDGNLEITLADVARWQDSSVNDVLLMLRGRLERITRENGPVPSRANA